MTGQAEPKRTATPASMAGLNAVAAGLVVGLLAITLSAAGASLIFSGNLVRFLPIGIGLALVSSAILIIATTFASRIDGAVALPQEVTFACLAMMAASISATLPFSATATERLATIVCVFAVASIATGVLLTALGFLRIGRLLRFVPVPVVGGLLAGIGCFMIFGGLTVATGIRPSLDALHAMITPVALLKISFSVLVAAALWYSLNRSSSAYVIPANLILAMVLFHALGQITGYDIAELRAKGWFPAIGTASFGWPPISLEDISAARWPAVAQQTLTILAMMAISAITILMNISAIETGHEADADIDHELKVCGSANVVAGLAGGTAGYHASIATRLNQRLAGSSRIGGFIAAALCVAMLIFGRPLLDLVPLPLLGGILLWAGVELIRRWLVDTYHQLTGGEYAVIVLMTLVINAIGLVEGMVTGLIAGIVLFAVDYSRVDLVKTRLTGETFQSKRTLSEDWRNVLREHGRSIVILRLQGFIFFGTAHQFVERVRKLLNETGDREVRFLVLDMRRTSGIDSSATASFAKLEQMAQAHRFKLVLTDMPEQVEQTLRHTGIGNSALTPVRTFDTLDQGLLWCEEKLIYRVAPALADVSSVSLRDGFIDELFDERAGRTMLEYMQQKDLRPGEILIEQGTESRDMYFVESGKFIVELTTGDGQKVRLSSAEPGSFVGEISFYLGQTRSASVTCEVAGRVWRLSRENLDALRSSHPEIASYFHQRMAVMLADRLSATTRLVQHLVD